MERKLWWIKILVSSVFVFSYFNVYCQDIVAITQSSNLRINLQGIRNNKGVILLSLFSSADGYPSDASKADQKIRMPGFVVPLDAVRNGQREFLLVPYFGACIHTPPPPANQIVLVTPHPKLNLSKTLESMDVIWVEGVLKEARTKTTSGVSGYSLEAVQIYPYTALHNTKK